MVCDRCKSSVEDILNELKIPFTEIKLGEVGLSKLPEVNEKKQLSIKLRQAGFELLEDRDSRLINKIKSEVIRFVQNAPDYTDHTLSGHLSVHLNKEYSSLSKLFSTVEGRTIEQYYIQQRIEKVKELLIYDELTLSEIGFKLGYSSVAHLSAQFKKITGMTPTAFKKLGVAGRKKLDEV
tara:strand:- start:324 stop:863 length:540 start_codon:yes stop_codon:yes gene_type:complete